MDHSTAAIRRRLFLLQLKSFGIVVTISMVVILTSMTWVVMRSVNVSPLERLPIASTLEGYYLGNNRSWDGVAEALTQLAVQNDTKTPSHSFWEISYLVDDQGILVYQSAPDTKNEIGKPYSRHVNDIQIKLKLEKEEIGTLVIDAYSIPSRLRVIGTLLLPVLGIAIILTAFLLVSNYYIVRRIINPLSDTIAAAKEVADGNLQARVQVKGPDDLNALNETFNTMVSSLEDANATRREFLADIAHELRTPLTIMRGRLEGIIDGIYPADEAHLAPALQATYLLERLVEDLRTLTLAETRQLHFDRKSVDLRDIARATLQVFQVQAEADGIQLELIQPDQPVLVQVDSQRVEQVLGNVFQNSLRHLTSGGNIEIEVSQKEEQAVIRISDDGPGVPVEDLKHIFDRFWRKEKSRSRQTGGSGLGLAISRQLIEAQGGSIRAEQISEGGLLIEIAFPSHPGSLA